jgi:hypothetical protein
MKLVLLVEGQTESRAAGEFIKRWLDPQLTRPIAIPPPVILRGYANFAKELTTKARMYLDQPHNSEIIAVIGLLDLYGPGFYPPDKSSASERQAWAKQHFEVQVARDRFHMYFAVHETEEWLLSQPEIFPTEVQKALPEKRIARPEQVNFQEPPAKLLNRVYRQATGRNYKKTTHGQQLFKKLDPALAAARCPYLQRMLDDLLSLAKAAGA